MASQKHHALKSLYEFLVEKSPQNIIELAEKLGVSSDELRSLISKLITMGLDISIKEEKVTLENAIEKIHLTKLSERIQFARIKKPIIYLFSTASTNELAKKDKTPSIYLCDYQSEGRGRRGKTWITPLGQSIALSISHKFTCGISGISGLNIAIGVAIINTIESLKAVAVGLKWPNDVLGKEGKIAGILIDASGNNTECMVTIGIGINWNIRQSLFDTVEQDCMNLEIAHVSRTEFIAQLIIQVEKIIKLFERNQLESILSKWNKHDVYLGKTINIIQSETTTKANYRGINKKGYLQVEVDGKHKSLASGEVTIRMVD